MHTPDLTVQRVRHPLKMRLLRVLSTRMLTPRMVSVTFGSDDLRDFISASFDDHIKLFFPAPGASEPVFPSPDAPEGAPRPIARDYTPRRYDTEAQELEVEFVLHGEGPATNWASRAQAGDLLGVGGPRGSFIIPTGFDWLLMIGDETAIPAIARRLEESPPGARVIVVIETEEDSDRIPLLTQAHAEIIWIRRGDGADALQAAVRSLDLPATEGYAWAAGEGSSMRAIHHHLTKERGLDKSRVRAASYWKHGAIAVHETVEG